MTGGKFVLWSAIAEQQRQNIQLEKLSDKENGRNKVKEVQGSLPEMG